MRTSQNLVLHEFIGLHTKIDESSDPTLVGLSGKIIDETKNMFIVNTSNGVKKIAKNICKLGFNIQGDDVKVDGRQITKRSEDRLGGRA
jgi:ribonuclease P protein subunit POP4